RVTSFPSDPQVLVDEVLVARETPVEIERPPGTYSITVRREGYEPMHRVVEIKAGSAEEFPAKLTPVANDVGFVLQSEPPVQEALLDGKLLVLGGRTSNKVTRISTGTHKIEIKATGCYAAWTQDVAVEAGKPLPIVRAELKPAEVKARIQSEPPHAKV